MKTSIVFFIFFIIPGLGLKPAYSDNRPVKKQLPTITNQNIEQFIQSLKDSPGRVCQVDIYPDRYRRSRLQFQNLSFFRKGGQGASKSEDNSKKSPGYLKKAMP